MSHWVEDKLKCRDYDTLTSVLKEFGYEVSNLKTVKNNWLYQEKECDLVFTNPELEDVENSNTRKEGVKFGVNDGELIYDSLYHYRHKEIKEKYIQESSKKELLKQGFQVREKEREITGTRYHNGRRETIRVNYRTTNKDTEVRVETNGFFGRRCQDATANLEKNLGIDTNMQYKSEFYQKDPTERIWVGSNGLCG